jgi:hypothetical protein
VNRAGAARAFADPVRLAGLVRATFGAERSLTGLARLAGGSKKGVYRLTFDDASSAVLYVWDAAENYWPARPDEPGDPFADASGLALFLAAHAALRALGVRTPAVLRADGTHEHYPADVALVEDVRGGTLEALLAREPGAAAPVVDRLADAVAAMHRHRGPRYGRPADLGPDPGGRPPVAAPQLVRDRALRHLAEAAPRVARIGAVRDRLADTVRDLAAAVEPRTGYGLIHGELGPDHVLIGGGGRGRDEPVLIDIEGVMFFDVEWEHVFLELRFGPHYARLRRDAHDLDPRRLRLYRLANHLSLVAGPLALLDGDFPDRAEMLDIVAYNVERVLAVLG